MSVLFSGLIALIYFVLLTHISAEATKNAPNMENGTKWKLSLSPALFMIIVAPLIIATGDLSILVVLFLGDFFRSFILHHNQGFAKILLEALTLVRFIVLLLCLYFGVLGVVRLWEVSVGHRYGFLFPTITAVVAFTSAFARREGLGATAVSFLLRFGILTAVVGFGRFMVETSNRPNGMLYLFVLSAAAFVVCIIPSLSFCRKESQVSTAHSLTVLFLGFLTAVSGTTLLLTSITSFNKPQYSGVLPMHWIPYLWFFAFLTIWFLTGKPAANSREWWAGVESFRLHNLFWIVYGPLLLLLVGMLSVIFGGILALSAYGLEQWWSENLNHGHLVALALSLLAGCIALYVRNWTVWKRPSLNIVLLFPFVWALALTGEALTWEPDTMFVLWILLTLLCWLQVVAIQIRQDREAKASQTAGKTVEGA